MASDRKPSLFAQRMIDAKNKKIEKKNCSKDKSVFGNKSNILSGPDAQSIHVENVQKLACMTSEEIEYERSKLLQEMDPAIVKFIRSMKSNQSAALPEQMDTVEGNIKKSPFREEESQYWKEPLPIKPLVNAGLHMDIIEHEKLKWMEEVPPPVKPSTGTSYAARFNFNGDLLPYVEEEPTEGLYHHGEEPERPGYTLQELMQLSRSSVLQQRLTSITTIGNILFKAGDYDCFLEKPLLSLLLDSELFLLLRFTIDDSVHSVRSAAVTAMCNLIVNHLDEECLDRLLGIDQIGLQQPLLHVQLDMKTSEIMELKDSELLKIDVIKGTLRTGLLPRFRYILAKMSPQPTEIVCILKILIRIARHSYESAMAIVICTDLLVEVQNLLNSSHRWHFAEAMKLFRILASHSHHLASQLLCSYSLVDLTQKIIYSETRDSAKALILESFFMWQSLLSYNLSYETLMNFMPVLQRLSQEHAGRTIVDSGRWDLEHASALFSTLALAVRADFSVAAGVVPAIHLCTIKWLSQLLSSQTIRWSACKAVGAALHCIAHSLHNVDMSVRKEITFKVQEFVKSDLFIHCVLKMRQYSWLLNSHSANGVQSLPCLGCVPSLVCTDSPYPLIAGVASYLHFLSNPKVSEEFLKSSGIQSYFIEITKNIVRASVNHWYARLEINFLYTALCLCSQLQGQSQIDGELVHQLALVVVCCIHEDDRYMLTQLFEKIIFNPFFYSLDMSLLSTQLETMNLGGQGNIHFLTDAIKNLTNISSSYSSILGIGNLTKPYPLLTLTASCQGTENALPADWQFLPILRLYNCERQDVESVQTILHTLQWILIMETLRHQVVIATCTAAKYCRLACVFLVGNDLFRDVQPWLLVTLQAVIKYNSRLDFEERIPGLTSFYDFYTQLVEEFVGVSYCDPVFGQYILIPLQQCHSVRFRKYIWTEQTAVLRLLSTPISQLPVPLKEFLEPLETDVQLLNVYLHALATGRVREMWSPVMYTVARHHVSLYVKVNGNHPTGLSLLHKIQNLGNKELQTLLLQYTYC